MLKLRLRPRKYLLCHTLSKQLNCNINLLTYLLFIPNLWHAFSRFVVGRLRVVGRDVLGTFSMICLHCLYMASSVSLKLLSPVASYVLNFIRFIKILLNILSGMDRSEMALK